MPVTFGSVGDIISVSLLVKDLLIALNDSRGSSAEYQAVARELYILDTALLQVEQLSRSCATTPELHALYETAKQTAAKCRDSVAKFTARVRKYSGSLVVGGSGNILKDTARKIQWQASQKDAEIAKFRAEVTGYSDSINMLLATGMVKLLSTKNDDLKDQLAEDGRRTHAALDIHTQALKEVRIRLDDNRQLISAGNSLASRMMDRLEWIQKLGSELKRFMSNVIAGNIAIYREVVALRSAFSKHVDRPLLEDPFILEDAIGRVAPVHLRFINSWMAFQAVMEIRFEGKQGLRKICRKEYVLQESATGREVDLSLSFEDAFLPGQKITMSLVFKRDSTEQSTQNSAHCPRCNTVSEQQTNSDVLCPTCNMWFRRITEIQEIDLPNPTARNTKTHFGKPSFGRIPFGPKPLKRKLEEVDGEDGDYSRFKRIRVVSEARRVKAPKIFTEANQTRAFHTPGKNGNDTPRLFEVNNSKSAVDKGLEVAGKTLFFHGLVEEDTFELARSKHNSANDGWYQRLTNQLRPSHSSIPGFVGANVNAHGGSNGNSLQAASVEGREQVVKMLLDAGADTNAQGGYYGNALQAASVGGHEQVVKMLLDAGADTNAQGGYYGNALQAASQRGHEQVVKLLLDAGADANAQGGVYSNALQAALSKGHEQVVKLLLDAGADADAQGGRYRNALYAASIEGDEQVVKLLLDAGANANAQGGRYSNALYAASVEGDEQVVKLLLDAGANANAQGGRYSNALQAALVRGHEQVIKLLLDAGADANAQGGYYGNALYTASVEGREQVVKLLLDAGADTNAQGGYYGNALQAASVGGHEQVVKMLLDAGADTNAQGGYYGNALQAASQRGHKQVVKLLLDAGADANAQGGYYGNALYAASVEGDEQVVKLLLDAGADANAQGGYYVNALYAASVKGHEQVVSLLLDADANANAQGGYYGNALQAASVGGHEQVVKMLLNAGANADSQDRVYGNAGH